MKCLIPTDKKKSAEDILLEAVLNIRAGLPEPVAYEKIINVVLEWYGVDWTLNFVGVCFFHLKSPKL